MSNMDLRDFLSVQRPFRRFNFLQLTIDAGAFELFLMDSSVDSLITSRFPIRVPPALDCNQPPRATRIPATSMARPSRQRKS